MTKKSRQKKLIILRTKTIFRRNKKNLSSFLKVFHWSKVILFKFEGPTLKQVVQCRKRAVHIQFTNGAFTKSMVTYVATSSCCYGGFLMTSTYYIRKKKYFNHNLGGGGNFTIPHPPPPHSFWFSLNNSEMVKAITLWHFIRDIHAKFGISNSPQSLDIGQNSDGGISNFWISGQCLIKEKS